MDLACPGAHLYANLRALSQVAPALVNRISWPVSGDHVGRAEEGSWHYHWGDRWFPLSLGDEARARALDPCAGSSPLAVLGLGDPLLVADLLAQDPERVVYAWDRDPWLLRLLLGAADFSDALLHGKLRLLMGTDLLAARTALASCDTVMHPVLGQLYHHERRLLAADPALPLAFVARGGLFVDDVAEALWESGYRVYTLDLQGLSQEELALAVREARPRVLAAINYTEGLVEFCHELGLPLVCWEVDPSTSALPPARLCTDSAHVFTYRKAHVPLFRGAGFSNVAYLPLAANPVRRAPLPLDPEERLRYGGGRPTYVGSSIALEIPRFERSFLAVAQKVGGPEVGAEQARAWLDRALARQRQDLNTLLAPAALDDIHPGLASASGGAAAQAVAEISAAEKRLRFVAGLGDLGMWVWGDAGWSAMDRLCPGHQAHYRGSAAHNLDVTKIYNASAVNVDVGRIYQADIVTMRVFDIAACGGFVLAERSDALAEVFEVGTEIETHGSFDELHDKTRHYLAHPDRAAAFAARGRDAVLQRHTISGRLVQMLARANLA